MPSFHRSLLSRFAGDVTGGGNNAGQQHKGELPGRLFRRLLWDFFRGAGKGYAFPICPRTISGLVHLPQCIKKLPNENHIVLNREYEPIGFRTRAQLDDSRARRASFHGFASGLLQGCELQGRGPVVRRRSRIAAFYALHFAINICNIQGPMFTSLPAVLQNLPFLRREEVFDSRSSVFAIIDRKSVV